MIIYDNFLEEEEEEISLFDLITHLILRADKEPSENIAKLLVLFDPEKSDECYIDRKVISKSAAFIRDYLQKDNIYFYLKSKRFKK